MYICQRHCHLTELPDERMQFTLGMYGDGDFFSMKGVVEEFFEKVGLHERKKLTIRMPERHSCIRDVRQISFTMEQLSDILGEVHPDVADNYGIGDKSLHCCS